MLVTQAEPKITGTLGGLLVSCNLARHRLHRICHIAACAALLAGCAAPTTQAVLSPPAPPAARSVKPPSLGPYSIHLLAGGREMELAGDMPSGTTMAVQKMLDANPSIRIIHLNSGGGELQEGYHLSELIRQRHLTTYTSATCASACTLAFLAGAPRYLANDAWLGFHSSSLKNSEETSMQGNAAFYRMYHAAGLPDDFIYRALKTKPSDVWFPSHEELAKAHVVDDFVDSGKFATSGIAYWKTAAEVDQALQNDDLYAAISAHDTAAYRQIQNLYLVGARLGHRIVDIDDAASSVVVDQFLPRYIKMAADGPVLRYQRAYVAKLDFLTQAAPQACAAQAFPELGYQPTDYIHLVPQSIKQELLEALADITNSAFEQPHQADTSGQIYTARTKYFRRFSQTAPDAVDVIERPEAHRDDPTALCQAATELYKRILDQPTAEAAVIARDFMGGNS